MVNSVAAERKLEQRHQWVDTGSWPYGHPPDLELPYVSPGTHPLEINHARRLLACWWCVVVTIGVTGAVSIAFVEYGALGHVSDILHFLTGWRQ